MQICRAKSKRINEQHNSCTLGSVNIDEEGQEDYKIQKINEFAMGVY